MCFWLLLLPMLGCAPNHAWRDVLDAKCPGDPRCDRAVIERHPAFDLAFVEFTERGNVFDRNRMQAVLDHVKALARQEKGGGVLAVVFVHGWKHNASPDDKNVKSFREWLPKAARLSPRRVVGIYIGWRGLSLDLGPLANVSYWDRKAVAHEVGKGGATEFLLRLEQVLQGQPQLVIGHSFGGAIVLTALNEVLLERVIAAPEGKSCEPGCQECFKTRPFGHGVVLLNPAIEANEVLQLKELVSQRCFAPSQSRLMHVISSDADRATNKAFRMGQWLGVSLRWSETTFERKFGDKSITLDESDLDTITVGNFKPYQTGQLTVPEKAGAAWDYKTCVASTDCLAPEDKPRHIPARRHEPLAFIHTNAAFIADHNDIFNNNVAAYLAAIVHESRHLRILSGIPEPPIPPPCKKGESFDFGACLSHFRGVLDPKSP